jgi:membrane-associated phospholipid phosphatase
LNWIAITDLGDAAVTVPLAWALAAWLAASRAWHDALAWLLLFGTGAFLVLCSQIAYAGWEIGVAQVDFTCICGHALGATSVLTVIAYFLGGRFSRTAACIAGSLGFLAGVLIGVSRVILDTHSPSEVIAGCTLGGLIALATLGVVQKRLSMVAAPFVFAVATLVIVTSTHGQHAPRIPSP